jgi:hypothetical protein
MPLDVDKASVEQAVKVAEEMLGMTVSPLSASKNHPLLNHPLWLAGWLIIGSRCALRPQEAHSESLCKRISCIVAQTIARQLVSVVNTSI